MNERIKMIAVVVILAMSAAAIALVAINLKPASDGPANAHPASDAGERFPGVSEPPLKFARF